MNSEYVWVDIVRLVILVLFGLTVGHVAWIVKLYARRAKRLLPRHISVVGIAFLVALAEVAWQNIVRIGDPPTWYVPINFAVMAFSLFAMRDMRRHLRTERLRTAPPA